MSAPQARGPLSRLRRVVRAAPGPLNADVRQHNAAAHVSIAKATVDKANFFLDQAQVAVEAGDRAFGYNLEAAVVFTRSITLHLQKQYSKSPGFDSWYAAHQTRLAADQRARFLLEKRNYVLKEGTAATNRVIHVTMAATISLSDSIDIRIVRGVPWYRRSPRIFYEDAAHNIRQWLRKRSEARQARVRAARRSPPPPNAVRTAVFFSEPEWQHIPAIDLVREHVIDLESMVSEAERMFSNAENGSAA